jgi:hypothetical protein
MSFPVTISVRKIQAVALCFLASLLPACLLLGQTPKKQIELTNYQATRSISLSDGGAIEFRSTLAVRVTVNGSAGIKKQTGTADISYLLTGQSLSVDIQENQPQAGGPRVVVVSIDKKQEGYIQKGEVTINLPLGVATRFSMAEGSLNLNRLDQMSAFSLGSGDVRINDVQTQVIGQVDIGSIVCRNSRVDGSLSVQSGQIDISATSGNLSLNSARSGVNLNSSQPVKALLKRDNMILEVVQADITASLNGSNLDLKWQGSKQVENHQVTIQATGSVVSLNLPGDFSATLALDQSETMTASAAPATPARPTGKKTKLESDFSVSQPAKKEIEKNGNKLTVQQGTQFLGSKNANGEYAHRISLHTTNSEVYLKRNK